jgi:hypothetical protein
MKRPQRPLTHSLEELSNRFFKRYLPNNWTTTKPQNDYGIDEIVNIFDGIYASPYELYVQLKSSQNANDGEIEKAKLRISTYNHLKHLLHVAMLIKFVEEENEAYWILLIDIPEPNQENETFTAHIPKANKFSEINWQDIEDYIREIVDYKLNSAEVLRNKRKNTPIQS